MAFLLLLVTQILTIPACSAHVSLYHNAVVDALSGCVHLSLQVVSNNRKRQAKLLTLLHLLENELELVGRLQFQP